MTSCQAQNSTTVDYNTIKKYARENRKNQTPAEAFFWEKVRDRRFWGKKVNRQFIIQHEETQGKRRFFIADFYCHEYKLIIEIDGDIHNEPDQVTYDQNRTEKLTAMGFEVIRFKNEEVLEDWEKVAGELGKVMGV